jgi:hypothetical protein
LCAENGDGDVSCQEFSKTFLALGFAERERELKAYNERQRKIAETRKAIQEKKEADMRSKNALKLSFDFTEQEFESAMNKLTDAAWRFDKKMPGAPNLDAFTSLDMEPHVFKVSKSVLCVRRVRSVFSGFPYH